LRFAGVEDPLGVSKMNTAFLDFVNSEFRDFRGRWVRDDLQQPGWLEQFLVRWNLQVSSPPDPAIIRSLVALRSLLRHIIETLANGQLSDNDQAELNAILLRSLLVHRLVRDENGYRVELVPLKKDWTWIRTEIVASFVDLLIHYDPQRLKICQNANCRWIFYDESKSRTKIYCTANKCANLLKVRRFRARHKSIA
jgi:predicted RNA-binding Zn ribbon-like protein